MAINKVNDEPRVKCSSTFKNPIKFYLNKPK